MLSSAEKSYAKECASLRGFSATAHVGIWAWGHPPKKTVLVTDNGIWTHKMSYSLLLSWILLLLLPTLPTHWVRVDLPSPLTHTQISCRTLTNIWKPCFTAVWELSPVQPTPKFATSN
jgi:hypothetical protein